MNRLSADFTIPSATVTALGASAILCFGGMIVYLIMMFGRVKPRQMVVGLIINVIMVLLLESNLHTVALADGSPVLDNPVLHMLYLAVVSALIEELSRFVMFRYALGNQYTSADAAVGFAIGFCVAEVVMGGFSNLSAYSLATYLNNNGLETVLAEAGEEAEALQEQLQIIADTGALTYILSGLNRIFYVAREVSLSVIVWYAATKSGWKKLLPAALLLHIVVRLPDCWYQAGGNLTLLQEEILSYALTIALGCFAAWLYKKLEEPVFHFKIDTLRARRRR
jgi:uncharacterized membrane protein YhfC